MANLEKQWQREPAASDAGSRVFPCIGDFLVHHARARPDSDALLAPGRPPLTYGGLARHASDVAHSLRDLGVRRGNRVAVMLPPGADAALAMISVASAAVCVPFNPDFTATELQRYFSDLRVSALVTLPDMPSAPRTTAHALGIPIIDGPSRWPGNAATAGSTSGPDIGGEFASGTDDAFILLTSGSTSRPKMVPLTHAAVCLSAHNVAATLGLEPRDRLLNVLPLFHGHGLISGLVTALAAGSSVVCPAGFDAGAFFDWLKEFQPTWYTAVPAIHRAVLSAGQCEHGTQRSSLRLIRSASSTLPPALLGALEAMFGVPVIDTFGMTEATTQIAANPLDRRKPGSVGPAAGPEIAILDADGRAVPTGTRGELALRGPTITRGYDNDPAATAASFRDGWFRTGDLGYLDEDGYLFIVGRIKDIIDRGGQKVAPGEVELALLGHPDVAEAVVFSIPHRRLGADVAAAVVLRPAAEVGADQLRDFVRGRLAAFKVPGVIRIVPEIPKGPAGKIKRDTLADALSITSPTARATGNLRAPRSDLERQLADCWMELLGLDDIGIDESIFALGADSITVTQMLSRVRDRLGVCFSFKDFFDAQTVAALAARIEASAKDRVARSTNSLEPPARLGRVEEVAPTLSMLQEHALRIERQFPGLPQFNVPFAYRLQGPLNVPALERSLVEIVRRHESLRTGFAWRDSEPYAVIRHADDVGSPLIIEDLAALAPSGNAEARQLLLKRAELEAEEEALTPFEMARPPLLRARLFRLGGDDHVLLLTLHDLIADGWSMEIFVEEVSQLYDALAAGRSVQLPEPALQFSEFARWQRRWSISDAAEQQLADWNERLRGASPVFSMNADGEGALPAADVAVEPVHVPDDVATRLGDLSRSQGATLFMTLLAAWKALLLARSGRDDICVATAMANRAQPNTERIIGPLGNSALIRTRLDAGLPFHDALARVRASVLETYARQDLPFDILAARLAKEEGMNPASLMRVSFVLQNAFRRPLRLGNVEIRPLVQREGTSISQIDRTWLRMSLKETQSGISGVCSCKKGLLGGDLHEWATAYTTILSKVADDPATPLRRLVEI